MVATDANEAIPPEPGDVFAIAPGGRTGVPLRAGDVPLRRGGVAAVRRD